MGSWVDHPELVEFYSTHRSRPEDLYPSEARFLPELAEGASSVLDVGCGAGGFAGIWRHFNPELRYVGVDASEPLVEAARRLHTDAEFERANGTDLPFADRSFEIVAALGWMHLEPRWHTALDELWRVTERALFFDVRLHGGDEDLEARQRLALTGDWDGTTIPYLVASWPKLARRLAGLGPARLRAHGYWRAPADTVDGVDGDVCMTTLVLERGRPPLELSLDLPLEWPL